MSMNPEQKNFEQLRRLLALKRHEQPPPGYFNNFSAQVVARIQADQARAGENSLRERLFGEIPWINRLWEALEAKPALAGAFGVLVCGLLISGMVYSEQTPVGQVAVMPEPVESVDKPVQVAGQSVSSPLLNQANAAGFSSTAGAASADVRGSLFDEIQKLQAQPRDFLGARADLVNFQK
jgi:hypothetical protein